MTAPTLKPGSPEWLARVTPSKISGILGLSPWVDPYTQWNIMAGRITQPETDEMRRGTFHEEGVLREFYHRHPELQRLRRTNHTILIGDWFGYTPDSIATDRDNPGRRVLIEAKTTGYWDDWGEEGTDEIPDYYLAQVITCAHAAKADVVHVFALGPFWEYREYVVPVEPELAEATLAKCHEFWLTVQSGIEPPLSQTVASYETWTKVADPAVGSGAVEIDVDLTQRFLDALAGERDVKPCKAALVNALEEVGAKTAVCQGLVIANRQRGARGGVSLVAARKLPRTLIQIEAA
jgi:hypothetical protein